MKRTLEQNHTCNPLSRAEFEIAKFEGNFYTYSVQAYGAQIQDNKRRCPYIYFITPFEVEEIQVSFDFI